ncbi:hypothetical protein E2C01_068432 [Portunus trituberculatus]|uniref:Uncharacterized protein n=1 Tax=Portunus trituberculatus TaxID=210409 RepID=A0A5B7HXV1_PORTR|nr:hypothetical protein [Portunus trituberculatus]
MGAHIVCCTGARNTPPLKIKGPSVRHFVGPGEGGSPVSCSAHGAAPVPTTAPSSRGGAVPASSPRPLADQEPPASRQPPPPTPPVSQPPSPPPVTYPGVITRFGRLSQPPNFFQAS